MMSRTNRTGSHSTRRGRTSLALALLLLLAGGLRAENRITVQTVPADAGDARVAVPVSLTHDEAIHAFSLALDYDETRLTLRGVRQGADLLPLDIQFFSPVVDHDEGTLVIGAIFAYDAEPLEEIELPASPDVAHEVAVVEFDVSLDSPPGVADVIPVPGSLGSPPVRNTFSVAGTSTLPMLTSGGVNVTNDNMLLLGSSNVTPGGVATVTAFARHVEPLEALSVAMLYDRDVFTYLDATVEGTQALASVQPFGIESIILQDTPDFSPTQGRAAAGMVIDAAPPFDSQVIPPSPDDFSSVFRFHFQTVQDASLLDTSRFMTLHNIDDPTSVNNQFTIDATSYAPELLPGGEVRFVEGVLFRRGYINADGRADISDGISILVHLFQGRNEPTCYKASDTNDDGKYDLSDSVYLFSFLFAGRSQPPAPYNSCGIDPTEDDLTCLSHPQCE